MFLGVVERDHWHKMIKKCFSDLFWSLNSRYGIISVPVNFVNIAQGILLTEEKKVFDF